MKTIICRPIELLFFIMLFILPKEVIAQTGDIALLYSKVSENMMKDQSNWIMDHLTSWELFLMNNNIYYDVIDDGRLEDGISGDYQTLIIPASEYLSDESINSLKGFLNNGGSVLLTWQSGFYNEKGMQRGEEYFKNLLGILSVDRIPDSVLNFSNIIIGNTPFSIGINAGSRMQVINNKSLVFTSVSDNYAANTIFSNISREQSSTNILFGNIGKGKFIWFGSDINSFSSGLNKSSIASSLIINSINWLDNKSVVWIDPWPAGKKSAVVLGYTVESGYNDLHNFLDILKADSIKAEFFIPTNIKYLDTLSTLKNYGDLCLNVDDDYEWRNFANKSEDLQYLKSGLEEISGAKIVSFSLLPEAYNELNVSVLEKNDLTAINSTLPYTDEMPWIYEKGKNVVIIPNIGIDDFDFIRKFGVTLSTNGDLRTKKFEEQIINDYRRTYANGSVYVLNYHDLFKCENDNLYPLRKFISEINKDDTWITTFDKIQNWWALKENLIVNVRKENQNNFLITLENNSNLSSDNIVLSFFRSEIISPKNLLVTEGNNNLNFSYDPSTKIINIFVDRINGKETKYINVNINNIL
jgi:Beta-galactosidase trimerisation domain